MLSKVKSAISRINRARNLRKHGLVKADEIPTETTTAERDVLFELASRMKSGVGVEIGSAEGASSCFLAAGLGKNGKLYCIDKWNVEYRREGSSVVSYMYDPDGTLFQYAWDDKSKKIVFNPVGKYVEDCPTFQKFLEGTADFQPPITMLRSDSVEAAAVVSEPLDLIFFDGWHEYEQVKKDTEIWLPKLKTGGIAIYHDFGWAVGVQQVVKDFVTPRAKSHGALPNLFWAVCM